MSVTVVHCLLSVTAHCLQSFVHFMIAVNISTMSTVPDDDQVSSAIVDVDFGSTLPPVSDTSYQVIEVLLRISTIIMLITLNRSC